MKCSYPDCHDLVVYVLPPDPSHSRSWEKHLCARHRAEEIESHLQHGDPSCTCEDHERQKFKGNEMANKLFNENLGLWRYVDLLEARLDQIARALGAEKDYVDSIGPLLDAIDKLKSSATPVQLRDMDYHLEEDERSF